jgi:dienelactone hydrolase
MKKISVIVLILTAHCSAAQFDPMTTSLVYREPGAEKVVIQSGIKYKSINDTTLTFDIYYPPNAKQTDDLPLVIFNNGVGGNGVPMWMIYKDWAKLAAVNGIIAVNHQSRNGKTLKDSEDLVDYLQQHASELHFDKNRMAIWACSGNVGVGMPLAMESHRRYIRALVIYYGAGWKPEDNVIKRQDLDILIVRAGLDFYNQNINMETLMKSAFETDSHVEFINYPEGQHAFDAFDDTPRTKEIIKQTIDFLKRKLSKDSGQNETFVLTNRMMWHMIVDEKRTDAALSEFKKAVGKYRGMNHSPWFNHVIDERNLNQMGYELMKANRFDDAIKVFSANQEAFPESANVYDALGDAYERFGDKTKAIANSKIALEKLEKIQNMQPQTRQAIRTSAEAKIRRLQ